jgi:TonB family protein
MCAEGGVVSGRKIVHGLAVGLLVALLGWVALAPAAFAQEEGRKIKNKVTPSYPELAKRMNINGTVKIQVTISPNGMVKAAKLVGGHPLLTDAAMDAVKKWKFEPAGEETTQVVAFNFNTSTQQ